MSEFFIFLQFLATLMISPSTPVSTDRSWSIQRNWEKEGNLLVFRATSNRIVADCRGSSSGWVLSPLVVQGTHQYSLDGETLVVRGDTTFKRGFSIYNRVEIPCDKIPSGKTLTWEVKTATHSLAH